MDSRTYRVEVALLTVLATVGLSACNETAFSTSVQGQRELDKLDPTKVPSPDLPEIPPTGPNPSPSSNPTPAPTRTPASVPSPVPSPTPSPSPSSSPTSVPPTTPTVPQPTAKSAQDAFNAPANIVPKVDMLFCVDNSGSMADKQKVLADSVDTFIGQFVTRGIDFHIGIVTTDVSSTSASYWTGKLPNYIQPNRGRLDSRSSDRFLSSGTAGVVEKFKANAKVGTAGSGEEACFGSMLYALDDAILAGGGFNEHFVRDDALLSMIIVTDEDEAVGSDPVHKGETVNELIARMKSRISAVKGPNSRGYSFDFVVNKTAKKPAKVTYPLTASVNSYPNFYLAAAEAFVGKTYDVLKNFGADLAKIGGDIINQAEKEYKLSQKPIDGTLVVKIDGDAISADATDGYVFHADRNTIELAGNALEASAGRRITIDYKYLAL